MFHFWTVVAQQMVSYLCILHTELQWPNYLWRQSHKSVHSCSVFFHPNSVCWVPQTWLLPTHFTLDTTTGVTQFVALFFHLHFTPFFFFQGNLFVILSTDTWAWGDNYLGYNFLHNPQLCVFCDYPLTGASEAINYSRAQLRAVYMVITPLDLLELVATTSLKSVFT